MGAHDLQTTVNYYNDPGDGSPPTPVYVGRYPPFPPFPPPNAVDTVPPVNRRSSQNSTQVTNQRPMISVPVTVTDVTGAEATYTLDTHGFAFHRHASAEAAAGGGFHDETALRERYYPECEGLLRSLTGAVRVVAFDHKVRRGPAFWHALGRNNSASRGPLHNAHVDQSYAGAEQRLREVLPDEADGLVQRRWQILNVWRPIKEVRTSPLAVADARSVADEDLVAAEIVYGGGQRVLESWTVKPGREGRGGHRWFYKWRMGAGEVVVIKCFDSVEGGGVARRAPHCAVEDPGEGGGGEGCNRESVEVRCLVFY
ncbi:hypothetical protein QBC39DRAFT_301968 [Podospora conica]|nr:hypothetical protein QBC39DRAFT_301968 [Schizothecium conicum]